MSQKLANLLNQSEVAVSSAIHKLENLSGFMGKDIKLLADISNNARAKMTSLGLDPNDTHGSELFHALLTRYERDENLLCQSLGVKNVTAEEFAGKIAAFVGHTDMPKNVWALKRSVAKNLIKTHPPKQLMKKLNYRSVDSLLKRENICSIYAATTHTESGRWQKEFWRSFSKLTAADFENREAEVVVLNSKRWKLVGQNLHMIENVSALGATVVWPSPSIQRVGSIGLSLLLAHHINSLRVSSAYIRLHQVENNFGFILKKICIIGIENPTELSHMPISWKTVFQHYGETSDESFHEVFESHILQDDIKLNKEIQALSKLNPVFIWWSGHEHVAANLHGQHVSLNLMDVMASYIANLKYEQRSLVHFRNSLWHNIIDKYMEAEGVKSLLMSKIGFMEPAYERQSNIELNSPLSSKLYPGAV
jgi:hypothetical protein